MLGISFLLLSAAGEALGGLVNLVFQSMAEYGKRERVAEQVRSDNTVLMEDHVRGTDSDAGKQAQQRMEQRADDISQALKQHTDSGKSINTFDPKWAKDEKGDYICVVQ